MTWKDLYDKIMEANRDRIESFTNDYAKDEDVEVYPYLKSDGFYRPCNKGCPNCKHCTDVFWDYSNGIYMTMCAIDEKGPCCHKYENDGTKPITLKDFSKLKECENEIIKCLTEIDNIVERGGNKDEH